jgi:hypothetical protein
MYVLVAPGRWERAVNLDVKDYAELIKAIASLLWPILAFVAVFIFKEQFRQLLVQLGKMNKGKFLGVELEITDKLKQDTSSEVLRAYLSPGGKYDDRRRRVLNKLLQELGIERDVRLILVGEEGAPFRNQLIEHARKQGLALAAQPETKVD